MTDTVEVKSAGSTDDGSPQDVHEASKVTPNMDQEGMKTAVEDSTSNQEVSVPDEAAETAAAASTTGRIVVLWPDTLQSPTLPAFSPAIDPQKAYSRHGFGLQLAVERAKSLNRSNRRCAALLLDITTLYDQFAANLVKCSQTLQPASGLQVNLPILSLQESVVSWSGEVSKMSATVRTQTAQPLHVFLCTHSDATLGIYQRYLQSRQKCVQIRQRALAGRTKYRKALRDAEQFVAEHKDSKPLSSNDQDGTLPKRVAGKLNDAKRMEKNYKGLVKWENESVIQCQRLEKMALESMQRMEEDRLTIFVSGMITTLTAQRQALEKMTILLENGNNGKSESEFVSESVSESVVSDKREKSSFVKMFASAGSHSFANYDDDTSGAMDADTLGLPEEVGQLRDQVRARLSSQRSRVQVARVLSKFLENFSKSAFKLGSSIRQQLRKDGASAESLHIAMASSEGSMILRLWDGLVSLVEAEAEGVMTLADSVRSLRIAKIDNVVLNGEKSIKSVTESDDASWKQLCEAARVQAKAEDRYRQSTADTVKARVRAQSVESIGANSDTAQPKTNVGKHVSKGIANMFAILPDGGEKAMKMLAPSAKILAPGAMASVAQRGLEEADQKEARGKQQLDTAVEMTALALDAYQSNATSLLSGFDEEEATRWENIHSVLKSLVSQVQSLRANRQKTLSAVQGFIGDGINDYLSDINEWRTHAQQKLVSACTDEHAVHSPSDSLYMLKADLLPSNGSDELNIASASFDNEDTNLIDDGDEDLGVAEDEASPGLGGEAQSQDDGEENQVQKLLKIPFPSSLPSSLPSSPMATQQSNSLRATLSLGKKLRGNRAEAEHADPETDIFLTYFWPDVVDIKSVPAVRTSFACSFRDGSQKFPFQYGRVYLTGSRIIFVSWTRKTLNLRWNEVTGVKSSQSFNGKGDHAILVTRKKESKDETCMILEGFSNHQTVMTAVEKQREGAVSLKDELAPVKDEPTPVKHESGKSTSVSVGENKIVPPDKTIQMMDVVVSKHIRNISIQRFYEIVWADKEKPLYKPWLEGACFDVEVGEWKPVEVTGPWCKERFQQERLVKFRFKRKTHLYIGPPIANVIQTHRCRVENNDKCVVSITVEFDGIPYADTFAVEVRWVALRENTSDVKIECGLFVDFKKKTFLKSKIQSGTIEESTPIHRDFFAAAQAACIAAGEGERVEEEEAIEDNIEPEVAVEVKPKGELIPGIDNSVIYIAAGGALVVVTLLYSWLSSGASVVSSADFQKLDQRIVQLEGRVANVQSTLDEILALLKDQAR